MMAPGTTEEWKLCIFLYVSDASCFSQDDSPLYHLCSFHVEKRVEKCEIMGIIFPLLAFWNLKHRQSKTNIWLQKTEDESALVKVHSK